ncbi:hypothetical protein [Nocardioides dongkuii]|uniref:hypothetical protein n=1 Tax=Nocardioides dongkuii TaxID=2760089 RepID=UPI0015FD62E2|nr:hypothetical protein [Nocardioides dongkuii]
MSSPAAQLRSRVPRIAGAAVERARLSVVPRTRAVRAARVPFVILVSAILLGGVIGLLMFNTSMQQASFTASTLEDRAVHLAAREQQLTAELEQLREPQHLAELARDQGMVTPPSAAYLHPDGSVTGVPAPAAPDGERIRPRPEPLPGPLVARPVQVEDPPEGRLPDSDADTGSTSGDRGADGDRKSRKPHASQQSQQHHNPSSTRTR